MMLNDGLIESNNSATLESGYHHFIFRQINKEAGQANVRKYTFKTVRNRCQTWPADGFNKYM